MLQKSGLYTVKNNSISIRLPNPSDFIYKWHHVSPQFKKSFVASWHEAFVLSHQPSTHKVYGVPLVAYKQLVVLDHIGYLINSNAPLGSFEQCFEDIVKQYGNVLDLLNNVSKD